MRTPLVRPEARSFNLQAALTRLAKVFVRRNQSWVWSKAQIPLAMQREEACFWYAAITRAPTHTNVTLVQSLADQSFTQNLDLEQVQALLQSDDRWRVAHPELLLPLSHLLPTTDLVDLVWDEHKRERDWMLRGLRQYILPYLSEAQVELMRQRLRVQLDLRRHPHSFRLAACLGLPALQTLVESWSEDHCQGKYNFYHFQEAVFGLGSPSLVEHHMRRLKLKLTQPEHVRAWLAHTECGSLDFIRDSLLAIKNNKEVKTARAMLQVFALVRSPEAAPPMLELMLSSRVPDLARQWLKTHPTLAISGLVPVAAGRSQLADRAVEWLQMMRRQGYASAIQEEIGQATGGINMRALVRKAPSQIPFDRHTTPEWLTSLVIEVQQLNLQPPTWLEPSNLPPILISNRYLLDRGLTDLNSPPTPSAPYPQRGPRVPRVSASPRQSQHNCLNHEQIQALLCVLQLTSSPHPSIAQLKSHASRDTLDQFVWELFNLWSFSGRPGKYDWLFSALGLLGGDAIALKLSPLIREWAKPGLYYLAHQALSCLSAIGTETALTQLSMVIYQPLSSGLTEKAIACLEAVANSRNLSRPQLEDQIVPKLQLDSSSSRVFNFGNRQFTAVLDAMQLKIQDKNGRYRTDLPKPGARDDPEMADRAIADWKSLKSQLADIMKLQSLRLEQAMVSGSRWQWQDFETWLVQHPVMNHLARLLVWQAFDVNGCCIGLFRITEDKAYADVTDAVFSPDNLAQVSIVHPLHLTLDNRLAWSELLSDYELMPPFPQLGRPIYTLEPAELASQTIQRFQGQSIFAIALISSLDKIGWRQVHRWRFGGWRGYYKPFYTANLTAVVKCSEVPRDYHNRQIESACFIPGIHPTDNLDLQQAIPLNQADPVVVSEVLNDLSTITAKAK